jgi:ferredoxin-NADP reductase
LIATDDGSSKSVVPLMAILGHRAAAGNDAEAQLLFSSRGWDDIIYRQELEQLNGQALTVVHTLTRSQPPHWSGYSRRVDAELLANVGLGSEEWPLVYVCGPTAFVETVAETLVHAGHEPARIRTERFGATGS